MVIPPSYLYLDSWTACWRLCTWASGTVCIKDYLWLRNWCSHSKSKLYIRPDAFQGHIKNATDLEFQVTGPMSIVEIAPNEIRGLLTAWFVVAMGLSLVSSVFCVYGVYLHIPASRLQYQVVFFSPCIFMFVVNIGSFLACESPRWLVLVGRREEAMKSLVRLRGMPTNHPRVRGEIHDIETSIEKSRMESGDSILGVMRETFLVPSNLRRVQQTLVSYALAQLSGANSVTSYFVPILTLMGVGGGTTRNLFLTGMYGMSKLFFSLIASFFFIDALGRRKSLFVGITLQMLSDIFISVYIKYKQEDNVSEAWSEAAVAAIFIHAFGYAVGK